MKIIKLSIIALTLVVSACTNETPELKSPCVGAEGSPCEKRRPINNFV